MGNAGDVFSAVPLPGVDPIPQLNLRTQQAVGALMDDPRYDGKTVVMVWDHRHIADQALALKFPDQKMTLRQLLNLDKLPDVPDTWPGPDLRLFLDRGLWRERARACRPASAWCGSNSPAVMTALPSNEWGKRPKLPDGQQVFAVTACGSPSAARIVSPE